MVSEKHPTSSNMVTSSLEAMHVLMSWEVMDNIYSSIELRRWSDELPNKIASDELLYIYIYITSDNLPAGWFIRSYYERIIL